MNLIRTQTIVFLLCNLDILSCTVLQSYLGDGYCMIASAIFTLEVIGPGLCLTECYRNAQCQSVNYYKTTLRCHLLSTDSRNMSDFHTDAQCTHYSVETFTPVSNHSNAWMLIIPNIFSKYKTFFRKYIFNKNIARWLTRQWGLYDRTCPNLLRGDKVPILVPSDSYSGLL